MTDTTEELNQFLDYLWGTNSPDGKPNFVYLPIKDEAGKWVKYTFSWPKSRRGVVQHILAMNAQGCDVYLSPALYKASRPLKENVKGTWTLWVDFDGNSPTDWAELDVPEPTLIVQSSLPGHEHCYWRLGEFLVADEGKLPAANIEDLNRSLAYYLGADSSGWDADQVLRPPGTTNYKRMEPVSIRKWER